MKVSQTAQEQLTSMNEVMKKMMAVPNLTDNEKQILKQMQRQPKFDRRMLASNIHALNALDHI